MAQAGILGRLEYREPEHGWALDVGADLSGYDLLSGTLTDASVPGIESRRRQIVEDINRHLNRRNMRYSVPAIILGGNQITGIVQELLEEMHYRFHPAHIACLLIGMANFHLGMALTPTIAHCSVEFRNLALDWLDNLDLKCGELGIDGTALFGHMVRTECNGPSIRLLLRNLRKSMTILSISADPRDESHLRLGEEHRVLHQALQSSHLQDTYKLETLLSCRPQDIGPALRQYRPTIVHFSGHGSNIGLCVEDQNGNAQPIDIGQLANVLRHAKSLGLQGVVMNACYSEMQAKAVAHAVGYVVAMEGTVSDRGAIEFIRAFYGFLRDGLAFDRAYEWALAETGLNDATGRLKPHLITA